MISKTVVMFRQGLKLEYFLRNSSRGNFADLMLSSFALFRVYIEFMVPSTSPPMIYTVSGLNSVISSSASGLR